MKQIKKKKAIIVIGLALVVLVLSVGSGLALNGYFGGGGTILSDTSTRGLVGYWDFNEGTCQTTNDSSNISNDGTITGATYTTGQYGTALNFDGTDDVITVTNTNPIDYNAGLSTYFR